MMMMTMDHVMVVVDVLDVLDVVVVVEVLEKGVVVKRFVRDGNLESLLLLYFLRWALTRCCREEGMT